MYVCIYVCMYVCMSLAERHGHTWIRRAQVKPNWAFKTRLTIQK